MVVPIITFDNHLLGMNDRIVTPKKKLQTVSSGKKLTQYKHQPSVIFPDQNWGAPHLTAWSKLSDLAWSQHRGFTSSNEWGAEENHIKLAHRVVNEVHKYFEDKFASDEENAGKATCRLIDIVSSMEIFMAFCTTHLESDSIEGFKLKICILHGDSATRCPLYHVDNIAVRMIQTLSGPGCVYLDPKNDQDLYKGLLQRVLQNDTPMELKGKKDWKERLVKSLNMVQSQAQTGEAAMLVGYLWHEMAKPEYGERMAVIHRSPHDVSDAQGRVLLTLDVIIKVKEESDTEIAPCDKSCCVHS